MTQEYDVVIVGGGTAGLSAALMLGRSTRKVLVVDSGEYRNEASLASHGFLTQDGTSPADLRRLGREQLAQYPVRIVQDRVVTVHPAFKGFAVQLAEGGSAMARKVILATGVKDVLPDIPGLSEVWGKSVWPCPYCDAWEVRGQPLGVLSDRTYLPGHGADLAVLLRTWSKDIIYFTNNTPMTADDEAKLRAINIPIVRVGVRSLESTGGILHRVWMMSGGYVDRRALFIKSALRQRSDLAVQLGLQERGSDVIRHGPRGDTTVPGVYIAGDTSQEHFFAITAAAAGANVGVAVNEELHREDVQRWRG